MQEPALSGKGFQAQYLVARSALEAGDYDSANRAYKRLLPGAGALEPRLRLEFAHSQLRAGDFDKAIDQARRASNDPAARAAALSVLGTATHEKALSEIREGNIKAGGKLLRAADKALAEVLKTSPRLDPLGALADRRASIRARLEAL